MAWTDPRPFDKSACYEWHPVCTVGRGMSGVSLPAIGGAGPALSAGLRRGIEHAVAVGYGLTYDAIVSSFPPYEALLDEVAGYAKRSVGLRRDPRSVHVLDVASGIGTLAFRLAREGYTIVGLEGVEYLGEIARGTRRARNGANVALHPVDIGGDGGPGGGGGGIALGRDKRVCAPER